MKHIRSNRAKGKHSKKLVYQHQSEKQKLLLLSLALRHKVRASHAAMHLKIKPSTATYIIRQYKAQNGLGETADIPEADLGAVGGSCIYPNCLICKA